MTLPTDSKARKDIPLARGCLDYFPDAVAAVAALSRAGNDKHNPGQPLHWSREKSSDHADCIMRHLVDRGTVDPEDGILHDVKAAWRALAMAQLALEARQPITKFEKYADPKEDPWVKGYRDWEGTLRFPAGPKVPTAEPQWIEWHGGECPVANDVQVQVRFRDDSGGTDNIDKAGAWYWKDDGDDCDIVAYRVL